MTQLSTDSLAYAQIVASVQKFISSYIENKNVSPKEFDEAYQKLVFEIRQSIGGPMSKLDFINKGDIPSSERFNNFVSQLADDINTITHQFDSLTANYLNSFNMISDQIESEKASLARMRSKIGALELYSSSGSNNITYLGDLLNNMDLIDISKSKNVLLCDVTDGIATLPKKSTANWRSRISLYNQNYNNENQNLNTNPFGISNGLPGCNFLYSQGTFNSITDPFLFQKDPLTVKSDPAKMVDESPISFYEYEAIQVQPDAVTRPTYEFEYANGSNYFNWSNFDSTKPLKMTVELTSTKSSGEYINYISVIPFFGYENVGMNAQIKNIKVTSIKLCNDTKTQASYEIINSGPVYIGADISGANINNYKNYSYNKGVFRFPEVLVNKVYITFEQDSFNDVSIKHAYWTPYTPSNFQNITATTATWRGQTRFDPNVLGATVTWNKASIVPAIDKPNEIKSRSTESVRVEVSYPTSRNVTNHVLKLTIPSGNLIYPDGDFKYYSSMETVLGTRYYVFRSAPATNITAGSVDAIKNAITSSATPAPCVYISDSDSLNSIKIDVDTVSVSAAPNQIITVNTLEPHNLRAGSLVYLKGPVEIQDGINFDNIFTVATAPDNDTFTIAYSGTALTSGINGLARSLSCYPVYALGTASSLTTATEQKTLTNNTSETVWLKRNYEIIRAKRASIGIRDIFLGRESYAEKAEIISKPFYIYDELDLLSLEVSDLVPSTDDSSTSIDYYISVDDALTWIQISPTQRNFVGIPEIISFNQNIPNTSILPQIAYYNYPEVPNPIKSIRFRAVMKKDRNSNMTPILGSYKLGIRFR